VPILSLLGTPLAELRQRAESLAVRLREIRGIATVKVCEDTAYVGGGSLPDQAMKTWVLQVETGELSDTDFAYRLRTGTPAVMGRLRDGELVLDLRTVFAEQETPLVEAVRMAACAVRGKEPPN
jgi:L-seryl-tRNA(Ser) seleniumtransferase